MSDTYRVPVIAETLVDVLAERNHLVARVIALTSERAAALEAIDVVQQAHESQLTRLAAGRAKQERKVARLKAEVAELREAAQA